MSWRVVTVSSIAKLDYKMDYLVVRTRDAIKRIYLSEISVLVIESTAVSLTAYLLCELTKRKIDIIFCDEKRFPLSTLVSLHGSHDTSLKYRNQIKWKQKTKELLWEEIIRGKICGQIAILENMKKSEAMLLRSYLAQIIPGDANNREGHAAKVYFNALFGMDFSRGQLNNINAALNYGYSILLSAVAREIVSCGYSTQLGIFHDNMFNHLNLASDLLEPFRPFVDYVVLHMDLDVFEHDEKMQLVKMLNRQILIDGKLQYMLNGIRIFTRSIFDSLNENDISLIRLPAYELQIYENDSVF